MPANAKFQLHVKNTDDTADEFESVDLNREKLVTPGQTITVFLGPLSPGELQVLRRLPSGHRPGRAGSEMTRFIVGLAAALALLAPLREARADYHVVSPYEIDLGELEIEHNGSMPCSIAGPDQTGRPELHAGTRHRPDARGGTARSNSASTSDPGFGQPTLLTQVVTGEHVPVDRAGRVFPRYRLLHRVRPID